MTSLIAVLIDLDDTLLGNQMETFMPGYLKALSSAVPGIPANTLVHELMTGTGKMLKKTGFKDTLADTFNNHFYPALGVQKEDLLFSIDSFYQKTFPTLQALTHPKPESRTFVTALHDLGFPMVVATNPLFPKAAQYHRLSWAGFPDADDLFLDITSFENYHFCKPHPEYYAEILLRNGLFNLPVVMIGNSLEDDILPAEQLGITTYWINESGQKHADQSELSDAGTLSDALEWIKRLEGKITPLQWNRDGSQQVINLKVTPAFFDGLLLGKSHISTSNNDSSCGLCDILQHLVDGDKQINIPRVKQFYTEIKPLITSMDPETLSPAQTKQEDFQQILSQFYFTRSELLSLIHNAPDEVRNRQGIHAIFGPTSFLDIVDFIAIHDRNHIQQALELLTDKK